MQALHSGLDNSTACLSELPDMSWLEVGLGFVEEIILHIIGCQLRKYTLKVGDVADVVFDGPAFVMMLLCLYPALRGGAWWSLLSIDHTHTIEATDGARMLLPQPVSKAGIYMRHRSYVMCER